MIDYFRGALGVVLLVAFAWLLSRHKKSIDWKLVAVGIGLQVSIALLIANVGFVTTIFSWFSSGFVKFLSFGLNGAEFLYGDLARNSDADNSVQHNLGFLFVFQALPTVIFFSAVTAGLYYLGVLQKIVVAFAWVMTKTMRLSGAESLAAAGNVFLGQTEAPLLVKPYIKKMTASEINCLMTGGMATIAGSVLGAYVSFLGGANPEEQSLFASYLLCASIMNAPAAIVMSKIFLPELHQEKIDKSLKVGKESMGTNLIHALVKGAGDGVQLSLNIAGMLLSFIAIVYALNWIFVDLIGNWTGLNAFVIESTNGVFSGFSLEYILGQIFRVFAFAMGVDWSETLMVGSFLGQKMVLNEFVAYISLAEAKELGILSSKSIIISTYALCGFANFSSVAIQVGGLKVMEESKQGEYSRLGMRALLAATLATMLTATIAGALF